MNTKEEMNENLKTYVGQGNRKIRITRQINKRKLESGNVEMDSNWG